MMFECPFTVLIEQERPGEPYVASVPALPGVIATGTTAREAAAAAVTAGMRALEDGAVLLPREEWEKKLRNDE